MLNFLALQIVFNTIALKKKRSKLYRVLAVLRATGLNNSYTRNNIYLTMIFSKLGSTRSKCFPLEVDSPRKHVLQGSIQEVKEAAPLCESGGRYGSVSINTPKGGVSFDDITIMLTSKITLDIVTANNMN